MRVKWTKEKVAELAKKFNNRRDFDKNENGAYQAARRMGIMDEICGHMNTLREHRHTLETLQIRALKFSNRNDFQNNDIGAYQSAQKMGLLEKICFHMSPSATEPYTFEEILIEAKKFKTRKEFQKGSPAYKAAWKRGILDEICAHMPKHVDQSGKNNVCYKWEDDAVEQEALKFSTRSDFKFGSPKAYDVAIQRKMMDKICTHMKKSINVSKPEQELSNILKESYPSITTFRLRNVNIPNKPHIRGLYLDIYVPELKKAIEFDGTYWHSFEGLKRSRPNWTDEEIISYHPIKDRWFSEKGIHILHIGEENWNTNKEACVQRCLLFLKS